MPVRTAVEDPLAEVASRESVRPCDHDAPRSDLTRTVGGSSLAAQSLFAVSTWIFWWAIKPANAKLRPAIPMRSAKTRTGRRPRFVPPKDVGLDMRRSWQSAREHRSRLAIR